MSLRTRETVREELMDDPGCDPVRLDRTYAAFRVVNVLAGWGRIYRNRIRPLLDPARATTLLDVGCGGGDVSRALARWAARDGMRLRVTGVDPDPRAGRFAARRTAPHVTFRRASSSELLAAGERFDVVVSNHVLHHLSPAALDSVLADSAALARRLVVHNDVARSRWAHEAFRALSWPLAGWTFVHADGLLSVRRSYRAAELRTVAPPPWRVEQQRPARLLLVRQGPDPDA